MLSARSRSLAFTVLSGCILLGWTDAQPQSTTVRTRTDLVLVPAVIQKHGSHVSGLKKEHFTLQQDGNPQNIAFVEEIRASSPAPALVSARAAGVFTNFRPDNPEPPHFTIVVVDTILTNTAALPWIRDGLLSFIDKTAGKRDPIALIAVNYEDIRVIVDFTLDSEALKAAIKELRQGRQPTTNLDINQSFFGGEKPSKLQGFQQDIATIKSTDGIRTIATAFGGIPGRKTLVWISGSFAYTTTASSRATDSRPFATARRADSKFDPTGMMRPPSSLLRDHYEPMVRALNSANIAVYPVLAPSEHSNWSYVDTGNATATAEQTVRRQQDLSTDVLATIKMIANDTGGIAFHGNGLIYGLEQALEDSSEYYMVGYYLDRARTKPGWHKITLKVSGAEVRTRSGFNFLPPADSERKKSEFQDLFSSPVDYTGVPMLARWTGVEAGSGGKKKARFQLGIAAGSILPDSADENRVDFEYVAVAKTRDGKPVAAVNKIVQGRIKPENVESFQRRFWTLNDVFELPPGDYNVRFAIRDNVSGKLGSVAAPLHLAP